MQLQPSSSRRIAGLAATLVVLSAGIGYTHNYVGFSGSGLVSARVQSPNATTADFPVPIPGTDLSIVCFKVRNTSPFDSRITAIGFDLPNTPTGFSLVSATDGEFQLIEQVSNVPQLPDVTLDFALVTGSTFGGGRPHAGLAPSLTLTTFCVSGPFPQATPIERLLDLGVLRVQQVGPNGEEGDVAVWENRPQ
jgi:hypothetical protein